MISPEPLRGAVIVGPHKITNRNIRAALALTTPHPEKPSTQITIAGILTQAIKDTRANGGITPEHPFGMGEQNYTPEDVGVIFEHIKDRVRSKDRRLKRMGVTEASIIAAEEDLLDPSDFT